jgi:hypothetical protein
MALAGETLRVHEVLIRADNWRKGDKGGRLLSPLRPRCDLERQDIFATNLGGTYFSLIITRRP